MLICSVDSTKQTGKKPYEHNESMKHMNGETNNEEEEEEAEEEDEEEEHRKTEKRTCEGRPDRFVLSEAEPLSVVLSRWRPTHFKRWAQWLLGSPVFQDQCLVRAQSCQVSKTCEKKRSGRRQEEAEANPMKLEDRV